jgi:hypothetical protein
LLAELNTELAAALDSYEACIAKAEEEPELARGSLPAWAAAFQRYVEARRQRDARWSQHLGLEDALLQADFARDVYFVQRGLPVTAPDTP